MIVLPLWSAPVILAGLVCLIGAVMFVINLRRVEVRDQVDRLADPAPTSSERSLL